MEKIDSALKARLHDKNSHAVRLEAIDEIAGLLAKGVLERGYVKDLLLPVMQKDWIHRVQNRAFLVIQKIDDSVKLPKKNVWGTGDINKKLQAVYNALGREYEVESFNAAFKSKYPEAFDVFQANKGREFNKWVANVLKNLPKPKSTSV